MEFSSATVRVLRSLGYLDRHQPYGHGINILLRILCLLSTITAVPSMLWKIVYDSESFVQKIEPLLAFFYGLSSFIFYSVMLWQRRNILDTLIKLKMAVNKRTFGIWEG